MLAKISSGKSVFGVLAYNKIKVEENHAGVLYSQKMFASPDGTFSVRDCMDSFEPYLAVNQRTEKPVFHASLNPDPKDKLSDERLVEIAQSYMEKLGYGNQPYIVFKHTDIDRTHCHIVSLRIDEAGKKINDSYEVVRSMKICKELEQEFGLVPLERNRRTDEPPVKKIDYKAGDIKHRVSNITQSVMSRFYFRSFGEYRTLLEQFNIGAEEIKGEHKGKPYNGILYSVIGEDGKKQGKPFKSSLFGKEVGFDALQRHYELSKAAVEKKKIRETLRPVIAQAMKQAGNREEFKRLLKEKGIGVIFRENEERRIYGVSFLDFQNQTILNGSRLGKEFSANRFQSLFNNFPVKEEKSNIINNLPIEKQPDNFVSHSNNQDFSIGSVFGLFDMEPSGADYEAEAFARENEWENKKLRKKNKYRKRGRQI